MGRRGLASFTLAAVLSCAFAWTTGCSSGSGGGGSTDGGRTDASGSSSGGSSGGHVGMCPTGPCASGDVCCANPASNLPSCVPAAMCAANDLLQCQAPADCPSATPDCCVTAIFDGYTDGGTTFPSCTASSVNAQCVAKCVSNIMTSCMSTETFHLCSAASDCAGDVANPDCCMTSGHHVCVPAFLKMAGGLTCL